MLYSELHSGSISVFHVTYWEKAGALISWGQSCLFSVSRLGENDFNSTRKLIGYIGSIPTLSNPHQGPLSSCRAELMCNSCGLRTDTGHQVQPEEGEQEPRRLADALLIWICSFSGRKVHTCSHPTPIPCMGFKRTGCLVHKGQGGLCLQIKGIDTLAFGLFLCDLWDATAFHLVIYFKSEGGDIEQWMVISAAAYKDNIHLSIYWSQVILLNLKNSNSNLCSPSSSSTPSHT